MRIPLERLRQIEADVLEVGGWSSVATLQEHEAIHQYRATMGTCTSYLYAVQAMIREGEQIEKFAAALPCRAYARGICSDGRDHCFNCGRHLNLDGKTCPKGCGEGNDAADDAANGGE